MGKESGFLQYDMTFTSQTAFCMIVALRWGTNISKGVLNYESYNQIPAYVIKTKRLTERRRFAAEVERF